MPFGPRELVADMPLDEVEDEVIDTLAALQADPDAEDMVASFEPQLVSLDVVWDRERATRREKVEATAFTRVADEHTDDELVDTGRGLNHHVRGDHTSAAWNRVFGGLTPTDVTKLPRSEQVKRVTAMVAELVAQAIESMARNVEKLGFWNERLNTGLSRLEAANLDRGRFTGEREEYVVSLNKARRSLAAALAQRAVERNLPKDWPSLFFRKTPRRVAGAAEEPNTLPTA